MIECDETVRGYEVTKGQYVRVEDAELEALEAEANSSIDMKEFIPIEKVDPIYFESSYYYYCVNKFMVLCMEIRAGGEFPCSSWVNLNGTSIIFAKPWVTAIATVGLPITAEG